MSSNSSNYNSSNNSSSSYQDETELLIKKILSDFFGISQSENVIVDGDYMMHFIEDHPKIANFDEKLNKCVQNKQFVDFINSLETDTIINILTYFGHLHGNIADNYTTKFVLTIASVLSGKNAVNILHKPFEFVYNQLFVMIILRALRKKSFITNIKKMKLPSKHFYSFMKSWFFTNKLLYFLKKIHKSEVALLESALEKTKKKVDSVISILDVQKNIAEYVYGNNTKSRMKLQIRIKLLIDNLEYIIDKHETYMVLYDFYYKNKLNDQDMKNFEWSKYYRKDSSAFIEDIDADISLESNKSKQLGNRRNIVVEHVDGRT